MAIGLSNIRPIAFSAIKKQEDSSGKIHTEKDIPCTANHIYNFIFIIHFDKNVADRSVFWQTGAKNGILYRAGQAGVYVFFKSKRTGQKGGG